MDKAYLSMETTFLKIPIQEEWHTFNLKTFSNNKIKSTKKKNSQITLIVFLIYVYGELDIKNNIGTRFFFACDIMA